MVSSKAFKAEEYDLSLLQAYSGRIRRMGQYRGENRKYRFLCYDCLGTWKGTLQSAIDKKHQCPKRLRKGIRDEVISGVSVRARGYEHIAIKWLLKNTKLKIKDILTETSAKIPVIPFRLGRRNHFYYPDIYIPKLDRIVEVKSTHTLGLTTGKNWRKNQMKARAVLSEGFEFTLLLMSKGDRVWVPREWYNMTRQSVLEAMSQRAPTRSLASGKNVRNRV